MFRRTGGQWDLETILEGLADGEQIGTTIAVDGDRIALGVYGPGVQTYVFDPLNGWALEDEFQQPDAQVWDIPGLALDGDTLAGGYWTTEGAAQSSGTVDVHRLNGSQWNLEQSLFAPDGLDTGNIEAVALSGDRLAFGDFSAADPAGLSSGAGAVYLMERRNGVWDLSARLASPTPDPEDYFGFGLDLQGSTLAVGAPTSFP